MVYKGHSEMYFIDGVVFTVTDANNQLWLQRWLPLYYISDSIANIIPKQVLSTMSNINEDDIIHHDANGNPPNRTIMTIPNMEATGHGLESIAVQDIIGNTSNVNQQINQLLDKAWNSSI